MSEPAFGTWKLIETAPKGTPILCAVHLGQAFILVKGVGGVFVHWPRSWDDAKGDYARCETPTHWMPLPPPPVPDQAEEGRGE